jgi:hypothetical protein
VILCKEEDKERDEACSEWSGGSHMKEKFVLAQLFVA